MDVKWIYWLAGLLDGEGWFGFQSTPHINISQVDLDIVEKAKSIFGNCPPIKTYHSNNPKHKTKYVLTVNGKLAISWMMTVYPLMSVRRKSQIRNVIIQWKQMTGHLGPGAEISRNNLKNAVQSKRNITLIKALANHRNISFEEAAKELEELKNSSIN